MQIGTSGQISVENAGVDPDLWLVTPKSSLKLFLEGLSEVKAGRVNEEWKALYAWYQNHPSWAGKIEKILDAAFYCHDREYLSQEAATALYGTVLTNSVTRLERFASCAFAHFSAPPAPPCVWLYVSPTRTRGGLRAWRTRLL